MQLHLTTISTLGLRARRVAGGSPSYRLLHAAGAPAPAEHRHGEQPEGATRAGRCTRLELLFPLFCRRRSRCSTAAAPVACCHGSAKIGGLRQQWPTALAVRLQMRHAGRWHWLRDEEGSTERRRPRAAAYGGGAAGCRSPTRGRDKERSRREERGEEGRES